MMPNADRVAAPAPTNDRGNSNSRRHRRRVANRAWHRLLSIARDASDLKRRAYEIIVRDRGLEYSAARAIIDGNWPWLPNKHCGSWYLPPGDVDAPAEVYFKSTDGHVGTYDFSLKRLNLQLLEVLNKHGGCFLVDSSARKVLPDSFSRTIPIWCLVINRIVRRYRQELGLDCISDDEEWDTNLHTPWCIVSGEEHAEISSLVDNRVEMLHRSKAIVDPRRLVEVMTRPVRAIWVASGSVQGDTSAKARSSKYDPEKYFTIVCCNPSWYPDENEPSKVRWMPDNDYYYTPGAADDHSGWGRGLTSEVFWANRERILDPKLAEDGADEIIDSIVEEQRMGQQGGTNESKSAMNVDRIGTMNLWVGSRRAGRPPECWEKFDVVLNVTENEYSNMIQSIQDQKTNVHKTCYYLQLPVAEGKKDKYELERWMPVGLSFLIMHLQQDRRVLVHCAQGRDRSVGVVLAFVALLCIPEYPLGLRQEFDDLDVDRMTNFAEAGNDDYNDDGNEDDNLHLYSGLSGLLVKVLVPDDGREVFLRWLHQNLNAPLKPFADKESIRIVLHLVRQDRENAEPSRSTMQKLNRFLQSSPLYRLMK
ncbi:hypothetical protein ACHAWF_002509 [Thalassiosira exigua]